MAVDSPSDIHTGSDAAHPLRRLLRRCRLAIDRYPRLRRAYRVGVAILGASVAVIGLILVPLPGPGWLIVFLGLAILGTEFPAAHRANAWLKRVLLRFWHWWRSRRSAA